MTPNTSVTSWTRIRATLVRVLKSLAARIAQGGAGHECQVIEGRMQAFAGAGVELGQWDGFIDEQDGLGGGDRGERSEASGQLFGFHDKPLTQIDICHRSLRNKLGGSHVRVRRPRS